MLNVPATHGVYGALILNFTVAAFGVFLHGLGTAGTYLVDYQAKLLGVADMLYGLHGGSRGWRQLLST